MRVRCCAQVAVEVNMMKHLWQPLLLVLLFSILGMLTSLTPTGAFASNLPPKWELSQDEFSSPAVIDLAQAFSDTDNDVLAFSVASDDTLVAQLNGDTLTLTGVGSAQITASDGKVLVSKVVVVN